MIHLAADQHRTGDRPFRFYFTLNLVCGMVLNKMLSNNTDTVGSVTDLETW